MMSRLRLTPLRFMAGLMPRLLLAIFALPRIQQVWFLPFLSASGNGAIDPWSNFLSHGGDPAAFPYGFLFLATFKPLTWIGSIMGGPYGAHLGLTLIILLWELVLVAAIASIGDEKRGAAAASAYWLSPIPLYVGYWHGQLDFFPAALMALGFCLLRTERWRTSGLSFGAAAAAKLSMATALPFVALYMLGRKRLQRLAPHVAGFLVGTMLLFMAPFALSSGFRTMVLGTPETREIFSSEIAITPELSVYVLPLVFLALFYWAWRIRRLNFEMLWTFSGLAFLALYLLTTAAPGWMIWLMPFLALHVARGGVMHRLVFWTFTAAYLVLQIMQSWGATILSGPDLGTPLAETFPLLHARALPILETLQFASGIALAIQMTFSGILYLPFYLASRHPFAIGIAGDSGTGKDTLVDALQDLFGAHSSGRLSGDDYHFWDRQNPMWRAVTHLHPKANDLEAFNRNVLALIDGRSVEMRHYDHGSGRSGVVEQIPASEIVLVSGLHALWSPAVTARYDVRIFMDMDEDLRRFVKMWRDVTVRGYPPQKVIHSIERRSSDRERFILPQADNADLIFRLEPRHPSAIADPRQPLNTSLLRLVVTLNRGVNFDEPARLLISLGGVHVTETPLPDGRIQLLIDGEPTTEDIAAVARRLVPDMTEFLDVEPKWHPDMTGIMQLIILYELDNVRRKRALGV